MMIAYCRLNCLKCNAFIATEKNDNTLRKKTAKEWSLQFKVEIKPEQINCSGCKSEGVRFFHCDNSCKIRKCCIEKKFDSCVECADFPCQEVSFVLENMPDAKLSSS